MNNNNKAFKVHIEGNISAGKSTLVKYFENSKWDFIDAYQETVNKWQNLNGYNLLELFYNDMPRWCCLFQSYIQLTRLQLESLPPSKPSTKIQLYERSLGSSRFCFLKLAYESGNLRSEEYEVLVSWYDMLTKMVNFSADLIVYLRASPEICLDRVRSRNRPEEKSMPIEYLKKLHECHDNWLISNKDNLKLPPVLILNGDQSLEKLEVEYEKMVKIILDHLETKNNLPKVLKI